ncbi:hypothetical protein CANINC_001545 [Pichia inconspicua]|uniref:GPI-anchored wall transfer protein n=1 Tax=Pichia inconspicua TaxID=52247 RepID=A0A4T0X4K5_9ASCO|nr:hypothetical protein CANINC_001545 [[Candida] inconspicua]
MATLKERKTQFVSDLVGGSTLDIYQVTSVSALSYLVWCVLKKRTNLFAESKQNESFIATAIDFLLNWNNLLLATTLYANNIQLLIFLNLGMLILALGSSNTVKSTRKVKENLQSTIRKVTINLNNLTATQLLPSKTFITVYRAQMMVITCISIMAVDFNIFPRRFAKVETWGTSLMDLGVGSFVFSMGLISARTYLRQLYNSNFNYTKTIVKSIKSSFPIFVLGLVRLISTKSVDYHEHVTEYGLHWNFFFTLASLPILNALLSPLILRFSPLLTSIVCSIIYENFLINKSGIEFIIKSPRDNFFTANREGILSLGGYFPIFLNGLSLGACILPVIPIPNPLSTVGVSKQNLINFYKKKHSRMSPLKSMLILSLLFQISYYIIDTCYIYSVSRRMANILYVIWVSAYNCTFLLLYGVIEKFVLGDAEIEVVVENSDTVTDIAEIIDDTYVPTSLIAVNNNSLVLFLIANLTTGLINLSINTIDANALKSLVILIFYEGFLSWLSLYLFKKGITLR